MTALLEAPVGALDVSMLEQRQPDVPLVCTFARYTVSGARATTPCPAEATWEALCVGCGAVFRRCDGHYAREQSRTAWSGRCKDVD